MITLQPVINLHEERCWTCGRHWAAEKFSAGQPSCPFCAGKELSEMREEKQKLERAVRSYKAIFARKKK